MKYNKFSFIYVSPLVYKLIYLFIIKLIQENKIHKDEIVV